MSDQKAWRCAICGYVHRGVEPPDCCPICGVSREEFKAFDEPSAVPAKPVANRWRCAVCNYVHEGPEPPGSCVLCGAGREQFEPLGDEPVRAAAGPSVNVIIVGGGGAAVAAAEALRKAAPSAAITILSREKELPYYRINLTRYLAGEVSRDTLVIHPEYWYREQNIDLRLGAECAQIDLEKHFVLLHSGARMPFDRLILASGAHAFVPPIPGANRAGVVSLRTIEEADLILRAAKERRRFVCVGGGLLGLEAAAALARHGASVTVLESFPHLMPSQLDARAGAFFAAHLSRTGLQLRLGVHIKELVGDERVAGVLLEEGDTVPADVVVLSTGVRPNSHLARQAGLTVKKGVVVDNMLRTSHRDVFAAGDLAEHQGILYGNWSVAQSQGGIAGMNAAGLLAEFGGVPRAHTLKVVGLDTFSVGQFAPLDGSYRALWHEGDKEFKSFVFRDGLLVGANLLGDTSLAGSVKSAIENRWDFSGVLANNPSAQNVCGFLKTMAG